MNENSSIRVGKWIDLAAASGLTASAPIRAIAPSSAIPVRSICTNGSPPRIMPR